METSNGLDPDLQDKILFIFNNDYEKLKKILLSCAYSSTVQKIPTVMRIGCIGTLMSMSRMCLENQEKMENQLKILLYMRDFEKLNIPQSINQFESCNKTALAKSLWLSHRNSIGGLHLIVKICIDYGIYDDLLENALKGLALKNEVLFN